MSPLAELLALKLRFQRRVRFVYEDQAEDCSRCTHQSCCNDPHFVNVHVTRLEAAAIEARLATMAPAQRDEVRARAREAVEAHGLVDGDHERGYVCPLFARGVGCLVHGGGAKPAACIVHACYAREEDQPPRALEGAMEATIEGLNRAAYGEGWRWRSIPLWLADPSDALRSSDDR